MRRSRRDVTGLLRCLGELELDIRVVRLQLGDLLVRLDRIPDTVCAVDGSVWIFAELCVLITVLILSSTSETGRRDEQAGEARPAPS